MNVTISSVPMRSKPIETFTTETECLFGETVQVLDESCDWVYCKLQTDNYHGWIKKNTLGPSRNPTHRVLVKRSFIYKDKNPKSNCLIYLPMGSRLVVEDIKSDWAEVSILDKELKIGYVPTKHIVCLDHIVKDWVTSAQKLEGVPYKWGGRDSVGIDCSALLQLSYQTYGKAIPRNTSEQIKLRKKNIKCINYLERGCVVFWEGHVGVMIDNLNCIHANSFNMQTKTEPLSQIIKRKDSANIIKMMNFN